MFEVCNSSFLHLELFDATAHFWKTELFLDFLKVLLIIKKMSLVSGRWFYMLKSYSAAEVLTSLQVNWVVSALFASI